MSLVAQAAGLVAFPVAAAAVGSTLAVVRRPSSTVVSGVQHFAAGVVIAALVGEVLPDLQHEGNLLWAVAGFSAGVVVVLGLGEWGRRLEARAEGERPARSSRATRTAAAVALPVGLLATVAVDLVLDGLLVGLGVTLGSETGLILTIALTIEILFLALAVAGELVDRGVPARRAATVSGSLGLLTAVGAIGGALLLGGASSQVLAFGLAFGAAALMYLAVEELLVEAHEEKETWLLSGLFFLGFLCIYVLAEVAGA